MDIRNDYTFKYSEKLLKCMKSIVQNISMQGFIDTCCLSECHFLKMKSIGSTEGNSTKMKK